VTPKLTASQIQEMRSLKREGWSLGRLAEKYRVVKSTIIYYCRSDYFFAKRKYDTTEAVRAAIKAQSRAWKASHGYNHHYHGEYIYRPCLGCGTSIRLRNSTGLCLSCYKVRRQENIIIATKTGHRSVPRQRMLTALAEWDERFNCSASPFGQHEWIQESRYQSRCLYCGSTRVWS
jgi:hypothetical protein